MCCSLWHSFHFQGHLTAQWTSIAAAFRPHSKQQEEKETHKRSVYSKSVYNRLRSCMLKLPMSVCGVLSVGRLLELRAWNSNVCTAG